MQPGHFDAARAAFDGLYANVHTDESCQLSRAESVRRGMARSNDSIDLTYGDATFVCVRDGLAAAAPPAGGTFYDLGSGSGRVVLAAALLFGLELCVGVEILADVAAQAAAPARRYGELRELLRGSKPVDCGLELEPRVLSALDPARLAPRVEWHTADLFDVDARRAIIEPAHSICRGLRATAFTGARRRRRLCVLRHVGVHDHATPRSQARRGARGGRARRELRQAAARRRRAAGLQDALR